MRKCLKNAHADVSSEARGLMFGQSLHLHPYFVYASGKVSDELQTRQRLCRSHTHNMDSDEDYD